MLVNASFFQEEEEYQPNYDTYHIRFASNQWLTNGAFMCALWRPKEAHLVYSKFDSRRCALELMGSHSLRKQRVDNFWGR